MEVEDVISTNDVSPVGTARAPSTATATRPGMWIYAGSSDSVGMDVEFVSYATVRDAIGTKSVTRDLPEGTTAEDALRDLAVEYEGLDSLLFTSDGEIRPHVNVLVNDENIRDRDGQATTLSAGDTVGLSPGVAGGGRVGVIDA